MEEKVVNEPVKSDSPESKIQFLKGGDFVRLRTEINADESDNKEDIVKKIQESLADAVNAKNVSFLLGSGCSSLMIGGVQMGISTMGPLAKEFTTGIGSRNNKTFLTKTEKNALKSACGIDINQAPYNENLEALLEVLYSWKFSLERSPQSRHMALKKTIRNVISKLKLFLYERCTQGNFSFDNSVQLLYESFYRKLIYRDRSLPRPWIFTTNYDLFNEKAMDSLGLPYTNGFSGTVDRRFNPAAFRYALAEQIDLTNRKWAAVDGFVYLGKLHGSVSWIDEDSNSLFPVRELQETKGRHDALIVYPTPAKHASSLASPYTDLFREFQRQIVREQSVLFVLGYSFSDAHINNIIYQALTIPTFRVVIFADPENLPSDELKKLKDLKDSRIWIIGGKDVQGNSSHYFGYFVEHLMPQQPSDDVDQAVRKVMTKLIGGNTNDLG